MGRQGTCETEPPLPVQDTEVGAFFILDASVVRAPDMDRLYKLAENSREGDRILLTVLEDTGVIPTDASPMREDAVARIHRATAWYQEELFEDYRDKQRGLNIDALEEIFDLTEDAAASSPIIGILQRLGQSLPGYHRGGVFEAERIARIMILDGRPAEE